MWGRTKLIRYVCGPRLESMEGNIISYIGMLGLVQIPRSQFVEGFLVFSLRRSSMFIEILRLLLGFFWFVTEKSLETIHAFGDSNTLIDVMLDKHIL